MDKVEDKLIVVMGLQGDDLVEALSSYQLPDHFVMQFKSSTVGSHFEFDGDGNVILGVQTLEKHGVDDLRLMTCHLVRLVDGRVLLVSPQAIDLSGSERLRQANQPMILVLEDLLNPFYKVLADYDKQINALQDAIKQATDNSQLYEIIDIQHHLVYFEDALRANGSVLAQYEAHLGRTADSKAVKHLHARTSQALSMVLMQAKLLVHLQDLFSAIVGNNLNNIMKIMTSATFVLTIPAVVGGIYGMNVALPFQHASWAFGVIMLLTLILSWSVVYFLRKKRMI